MTDPLDLDRLVELAEAATPGPWRRSGTEAKPHWYVSSPEVQVHPVDKVRGDFHQDTIDRWCRDAAYIAAVSPSTVLALVRELRKAWEGLDAAWREAEAASNGALLLEFVIYPRVVEAGEERIDPYRASSGDVYAWGLTPAAALRALAAALRDKS